MSVNLNSSHSTVIKLQHFSTNFCNTPCDKISKDLKLYMFPKTLTEICKIGWKISCKNAF